MTSDATISGAVADISLDDASAPARRAEDVSEEDKRAAEEEKESGNKLFAAKHYAAAIEAYTKAIELNPVGIVNLGPLGSLLVVTSASDLMSHPCFLDLCSPAL
jgi:tetratricopeptide (TPR) repeat protein